MLPCNTCADELQKERHMSCSASRQARGRDLWWTISLARHTRLFGHASFLPVLRSRIDNHRSICVNRWWKGGPTICSGESHKQTCGLPRSLCLL
ncbi:hypothetical protein COCON_G00010140 [Conger conger]|uniref:Uncharacterized protein n=1 Tax=Conger conger TaxID=82655 RepID=A0A9Q1E2D2_CONCO|nr:hypothetical protein COCON_G00010140 [Conger conger]